MALAALVTVTVYVLVLLFCAVTTTLMTSPLPTLRLIAPDGEPLATGVPLTVTVAWLSLTVGVTVTELSLLATLSV